MSRTKGKEMIDIETEAYDEALEELYCNETTSTAWLCQEFVDNAWDAIRKATDAIDLDGACKITAEKVMGDVQYKDDGEYGEGYYFVKDLDTCDILSKE